VHSVKERSSSHERTREDCHCDRVSCNDTTSDTLVYKSKAPYSYYLQRGEYCIFSLIYRFPECAAVLVYQVNFSTSEPIKKPFLAAHCQIFNSTRLTTLPPPPPALAPVQSRVALVAKQQPELFLQINSMLPRHAPMKLTISQFISLHHPLSQHRIPSLPNSILSFSQLSRNVLPVCVGLTAKSRTPHKFKHRKPILLESTRLTNHGGLVSCEKEVCLFRLQEGWLGEKLISGKLRCYGRVLLNNRYLPDGLDKEGERWRIFAKWGF
jgi:hypothetical protein